MTKSQIPEDIIDKDSMISAIRQFLNHPRLAELILEIANDRYLGIIPEVDLEDSTVIVGDGGLLSLNSGQTYTITKNGAISCSFSALLLGSCEVRKNEEVIYSANNSLGGSTSKFYSVSTNDVISASTSGIGTSLSIIFYPNK